MEEKYWDYVEKIDTVAYKNFGMNSSLSIPVLGMVLVRKRYCCLDTRIT